MQLRAWLVTGMCALVACGPMAPQQPEGTEGGACHMDGTCDEGLACQSGICHAAGLPDAPTSSPADAPARADARAGADGRAGADAAPGQPDAAPGQPDAPPRPPDAPPPPPDAPPPPPDAPPPPPDAPLPTTGELGFTWAVTLNGAGSTCDAVGAASVQVVATPTGGGAPVTSRFACADGAGTTGELAAGSYSIAAHLLDDGDADLADAALADPVTVVAGVTTPAGGFTFAITQNTTGIVDLSWDITDGGDASSCGQIGAATVELQLQKADGEVADSFDFTCSDGSGSTSAVAVGDYNHVVVVLLDDFGEPLAQVDLDPFTVDTMGNTAAAAHFSIPEPNGSFFVTWTLTKGGNDASCADVGADSVEVDSVAASDGTTTVDIYKCDDGSGFTDLLPPDDYDVTVTLLDSGGAVVDTQGPMTQTLNAGGLPELDFFFAE